MANEAETAIYNRLASAPLFHPASADLFVDDWALEAGDVVTVQSGEDSYSVPVYSMDLQWKGRSKVDIQSTGNQAREPLPALKRKQYAAGAGGYRQQKENEETFQRFETHFEQTDEYFSFLATEAQWDELAQEGHITAYSAILQNANGLSAEISRAEGAESALSGRITATATDLTTLYTKTGVNSLGQNETLYSLYQQNAQQIALKVSAGNVATQLAVELGNVSITGGNLVVDGYVTTQSLNAVDARIDALIAGTTQVEGLYSRNNITALGWITAGSYVNSADVQVNGTSVKGAITGIGTATSSGGQITIPTTKLDGTAGPDINFNIAATQYYIDGVAAAETAGWDAARAEVEMPSQGTGTSFDVKVPSATQNQQETKSFALQKGATPGSTGYASVSLNNIVVGRIEIGSWYDAGQNSVSVSKGAWSGGIITFSPSAGTGASSTVQLSKGTESWTDDVCTFAILDGQGSTGYTCTVDASARYTAGYNAGYAAGGGGVTVNVIKGTWSGGQITFSPSSGSGSSSTVTLAQGVTTWGTGNSANTASVPVLDGQGSTGYTFSVDASARYTAGETAGKNAVTINKGSWSGGVISFTKSEGTASTKTVQLSKGTETWSGDTCSFPIMDGSGSTGYTCTVDASARYTAGQNSVTVSSFDWTGNSDNSYNTIRANASNGDTNSLTIYMSQGSWSGGYKTVYVRTGSTSGTIRARVSVSMPGVGDASWSWSYPAQGYIQASVTIGGKTYSSSHSV